MFQRNKEYWKKSGTPLLVVLLSQWIVMAGCAQQAPPPTKYDAMPEPPHEILITEGDLSQKYRVLGQVRCEIKGVSSYNSVEQNEGYIDTACVKEAYARYGDKAHAIINMRYRENLGDTLLSSLASAYGARRANIRASGIVVQLP